MKNKLLLNLGTNEIIKTCCDTEDDKITFTQNLLYVRDMYNKFIHNKCKYETFLEKNFNIYTYVYGNDKEFVSNLGLSETGFLVQLCLLLNVDRSNVKNYNIHNEDLINKINERIELLKSINSKKDLEKMFPSLYDTYNRGNAIFNGFYGYEDDDIDKLKEKKNLASKYYSWGLRVNVSKFTETQADFFERLIRHREDIKEYCDNTLINESYLDGLNKNKLKLFSFYKIISNIKSSKNIEIIEKYIKYCDKHLEELIYLKDKIIVDGVQYYISDLICNYIDATDKYRIPKNILFNGTILHSGTNTGKINNNPKRNVKILTVEERDKLRKQALRKINLFNNSPYIGKISEKVGETGNTAYVYPNGHILIEYIPDLNSDSSLKRQACATYYVDIYGFEKAVGLNKTTLKKDKSLYLGALNHTSTWDDRVNKIINIQCSEEKEEETKKFLKTLYRKNRL